MRMGTVGGIWWIQVWESCVEGVERVELDWVGDWNWCSFREIVAGRGDCQGSGEEEFVPEAVWKE